MFQNYIIYICLLCLFSSKLSSQVGINTTNPLQALHIEGGNTLITTDDVIVTTSGNVGVGTLNPTSKLEIKGRLHYEDGSPNLNGRALISDSNGNAHWSFLSFAEKTAVWTLSGNLTIPDDGHGNPIQLKGTSTVSNDGVNLIAGANSVKVPKGRYLMFIKGDIAGNEYADLSVLKAPGGPGTGIYSVIYFYQLASSAVYVEFLSDTEVIMKVWSRASARVVPTTTTSNFYMVAPYTAAASYSITFLLLE